MAREIRLAAAPDAEQVGAIYAPYVAGTPISFELEPPAAGEMRRRILETLEKMPWLVCADAGELLGYAYAGPYRARAAYQWSVEVTVYVRAERHRSGVGRALYTSLLAILPLQGFYTVYAGITLPNAGSVHLHEAVGFEPVGVYRNAGYKLGRWYDVGWWQRPLRPRDAVPREPVALGRVRETAEWQSRLASGLQHLR